MAKAISANESPADRLGKLLPSEVTGFYVSLRALFIDPSIPGYGYYLVGLAIISTVIALCYIFYVRQVKNIVHIAVYTVTFSVWALSLYVDHIREAFKLDVPLQQISGSLSILLSFIFPLFVPSSTVASQGAGDTPTP